MTRLALPWAVLLGLLLVEVAGTLLGMGWVAWAIAPMMILVALTSFMQIGQASSLSRIFVMAGLFWLTVLIGLGSLDFLVRRDVPAPVPATTERLADPEPTR